MPNKLNSYLILLKTTHKTITAEQASKIRNIGLLKFICDEREEDWKSVFIYFAGSKRLKLYTELEEICPKEFLNSIFK